MRIFITGGTGYIGSHVARALADAGHDILALAHHDEARDALRAAGYETVAGDLTRPADLAGVAERADAVVHTANTNGENAAAVDDAAVRAMVGALEGSGKPFVYTSGIWVLGDTGGEEVDEESAVDPIEIVAWRGPLEKWLISASQRDVRTIVIRPGVVYGRGGGLAGMMARGELPVVGDGENRWPVVHVDDLTRLYVAALEGAPAGRILHGIGGHITTGELGEHLGAASMPRPAALEQMGPFAEALAVDQQISSAMTRSLLGWEPEEAHILESSL